MVELGEGEVAVEHGLHPLLATDSDPNVGGCERNPRSFSVTDVESVKGRPGHVVQVPYFTFRRQLGSAQYGT